MTVREIFEDIKSERKKKIVLDTDAFNEIDDQFAIAYCLGSKKMDLLAICAEHYMHELCDNRAKGMEQSYNEILKVCELAGNSSVPVLRGSTDTIDAAGAAVESEAADQIIKLAHQTDDIIYVLAIGAITNVVSAIMKDPSIKEKICVIWLGGNQLDWPHTGEYNLDQDKKGGQFLLDCGVPVVLVPACNVTSVLRFPIEDFMLLRGHGKLCDYLAYLGEDRWKMVGSYPEWRRTLWDIAAPAVIETPEALEFEIVHTPIITDESTYAFDDSRHEMIIVTKIDRDPVAEKAWEIIKGD